MEWQPVSALAYVVTQPRGTCLVIVQPQQWTRPQLQARWGTQACALLDADPAHVPEVLRDVFANPQIRAIIFDGPSAAREVYASYWAGTLSLAPPVTPEHQVLVRQFVDLYDEAWHCHQPPKPFHPARILYPAPLEFICESLR